MTTKWIWKLIGFSLFSGAFLTALMLDNHKAPYSTNNSSKIFLDINFKNLSKLFYLKKNHIYNSSEIGDLNIKGYLKSSLFNSRIRIQPHEWDLKNDEREISSLNISLDDQFLSAKSFQLIPRPKRFDVFERFVNPNKQIYTEGILILNGKSLNDYVLIEKMDINYALKQNLGPGKIFALTSQHAREHSVDNQKELDSILSSGSTEDLSSISLIFFDGDHQDKDIFLGIEPTESQ